MHTQSNPPIPAPDSVQQMRDALERGAALHLSCELEAAVPAWRRIEVPRSDAACWVDTEMDVRRVVL